MVYWDRGLCISYEMCEPQTSRACIWVWQERDEVFIYLSIDIKAKRVDHSPPVIACVSDGDQTHMSRFFADSSVNFSNFLKVKFF